MAKSNVAKLYRREARGADAALDHAPFAIDEFDPCKAHNLAGMVEFLVGHRGGDFVIFRSGRSRC